MIVPSFSSPPSLFLPLLRLCSLLFFSSLPYFFYKTAFASLKAQKRNKGDGDEDNKFVEDNRIIMRIDSS